MMAKRAWAPRTAQVGKRSQVLDAPHRDTRRRLGCCKLQCLGPHGQASGRCAENNRGLLTSVWDEARSLEPRGIDDRLATESGRCGCGVAKCGARHCDKYQLALYVKMRTDQVNTEQDVRMTLGSQFGLWHV